MTVLRQSKCAWCNPTLTWWDRLLDSRFAETVLWGMPWGKHYLYVTTWWANTVSNRWHRRFHKHFDPPF